jgi:hypothetical protein
MRRIPVPRAVVGVLLLSGCAAATQSSSTTERAEEDCSFRSATTCWTLAGRFPPPRAEPRDDPEQTLPVLASGADTALGVPVAE